MAVAEESVWPDWIRSRVVSASLLDIQLHAPSYDTRVQVRAHLKIMREAVSVGEKRAVLAATRSLLNAHLVSACSGTDKEARALMILAEALDNLYEKEAQLVTMVKSANKA